MEPLKEDLGISVGGQKSYSPKYQPAPLYHPPPLWEPFHILMNWSEDHKPPQDTAKYSNGRFGSHLHHIGPVYCLRTAIGIWPLDFPLWGKPRFLYAKNLVQICTTRILYTFLILIGLKSFSSTAPTILGMGETKVVLRLFSYIPLLWKLWKKFITSPFTTRPTMLEEIYSKAFGD